MATENSSGFGKNSKYIYPKQLAFEGGTWTRRMDGGVLIAELEDGKAFVITGKYDTANLSQGLAYKVEFNIEMTSDASGWDLPVNLTLEVPTMKPINNTADLKEKKSDKLDVLVGEFESYSGMTGEMKITMSDTNDKNLKKGLVVKRVTISPK